MLETGSYSFDLPESNKSSIIKVIGVGGGGSNAVSSMYNRGIKDVSFIVCNTDSQALEQSSVANKLQIGLTLTEGLGAGANPEIGKNAAIESKEDIKSLFDDGTKMLFITAGMGGGTGTGAAPIIASIAKKLGILTVGIVTLPFSFEGKKKLARAEQGIKELKENCDTVLVILNNRIKEILGNLTIGTAFAQADNVLTTAAKSIAEIITVPGYVNVDFEDVKTVMKNAGAAVMGSDVAEGEGRALAAAEKALKSPLLDYQDIHGAQKILLSIVSGPDAELQMDELSEITDYIQNQVGVDAELIFGHGSDQQLGDKIRVTVIATGFEDQIINNETENSNQSLSSSNQPELFKNIDKHSYNKNINSSKSNDNSENIKKYNIERTIFRKSIYNTNDKNLESTTNDNKDSKNNIITPNISDDEIKSKLNTPAYLRKKILLDNIDVDNNNIKKINLYDDQENNDDNNPNQLEIDN